MYHKLSLSEISHCLIFPKYKSKLGNHGNYIVFKLKFMISSSVSLCLSQSKLGVLFVTSSLSVSLNRIDKNWYCLITNANFFFEFLCFFVFSHFLVEFHRISLIFLSHISQKTQKSVFSSHLDSNTADSTSLITGSPLSYEMFIVHCSFWNWKILCTYWLLICKVESVLYSEVII